MPNIRTYTDQSNPITPDGRAAQGAARSGEAWSSAYKSIGNSIGSAVAKIGGEFERQKNAKNTAKLAADLATAQSELTVEWNKIAQETDPDKIEQAAADFREKRVGPTLDKIGESVEGEDAQNMFTTARAKLAGSFLEKTAADASQVSGIASVTNTLKVQKQLSNMVLTDPTSFDSALMLSEAAVGGLVKGHGLDATKAMELNQKFATSYAEAAAEGMIQRNPEQAKKDIADGRFNEYLDADAIGRLQGRADEMIRMQESQRKSDAVELRRQQAAQFEAATNELTKSFVNPNTGQLQVPADFYVKAANLGTLPEANSGTVRAMISMATSITNDLEKGTPAITDPNTYSDFRARAFLPKTDPRRLDMQDVYQARADRKLSDNDYSFWARAVNDMASDEGMSASQRDFQKFLNSNKGYITKSNMLTVDQYGDQRFYEWTVRAQQIYDEGKAAGKPEAELRQRIQGIIPEFQVPSDVSRAAMGRPLDNLAPLPPVGAAKRNPGESAADFLKRTGGQ